MHSIGTYIGTRHGLNEGTHHVVHLAEGEQIIAVVGRATTNGQRGRVKQLAFLTRGSGGVRNVFGPYGPASGTLFLVNANVVSIFADLVLALMHLDSSTQHSYTQTVTT